jgi:translation initiation factor IF-2
VPDYRYTHVAAQAANLAELFDARFTNGLDGPVHFRVVLSAPDGPSTAGGKQALQHIKLVPESGGLAVVIGSANTTRMIAEIRTYEHIATLYAQRFRGAKIPVDVARYYELGRALTAFFRSMKMKVTFADLDGLVAAPAPPSVGVDRAWMLLVGVGVGLGILAAAYAIIFLRP